MPSAAHGTIGEARRTLALARVLAHNRAVWPFSRRVISTPAPSSELFDEAFLRRLESLAVVARRTVDGKTRAERRSKKTGAGIELGGARAYAPGDDFRALDWALFARTEKLHTRLFEEEEDLSVYVALDVSPSMTLGAPPKLDHAKRLAAALAYVSLAALDRVCITTFADRIVARMPPTRGKGRILRVLDFLRDAETGVATDLEASMRAFATQNKRRGVVLVLSDFYDPQGFARGMDALRFARFEPRILHLVDRRDASPDVYGDVVLVDRETGERREVTVTDAVLRRYREAHARHAASITAFATEKHIPLATIDVSERWDDVALNLLRRGGILG
jgi:uncharacterized protein (DUF58 family)